MKTINNTKVLVINYHAIVDGNNLHPGMANDVYAVHLASFREQIQFIIGNHIPVVSLNHILSNNVPDGLSVALTFDDGNPGDYHLVYPFLKALNLPATFFWLVDRFKQGIVTQLQATEIISGGFTIGSHGISHTDLTQLSPNELKAELIDSKSFFETITRGPVHFFSLPFGMYNSTILKMAANTGYKAVLTTDVALNDPARHPFLIHRWSVKRSTTMTEFRKMLTDCNKVQRESLRHKLKYMLKRITGRAFADYLNKRLH
jgi:peptidoglycan/xylan/chitin deacetylase (PgdA/CDA1 family)